ncbi:MAG: hypothetical protein V9G04_12765 [Nocardioides sp.]|jgi:hypothetical protein
MTRLLEHYGGFGTVFSYASKAKRELPPTPLICSTARWSHSGVAARSSASTSTRRGRA